MAILRELFGERIDLGGGEHLDAIAVPAHRAESDLSAEERGRLLFETFTGTDRLGRKWVNGKEVKSDLAGEGGGTGAHTPEGDAAAETKARSLAARIKDVPKALVSKVATWVKARHDKLAARYGRAGAKAVLAGMILLVPTPIPGSSLLPIALAEGVLRVRRALAGARAEASEDGVQKLSAEEIEAMARALLKELMGAMGEK